MGFLNRSMIKVACGISGGVDSAVSAWLLKQAGYNVVGVYMRNWDLLDETADERQCSSECDYDDARFVCSRIGIPFESVTFVREYWLRVFERTLATYQQGWTPNPDILCNRHVKFDCFAKYARDTLKADFIATGHYARTATVHGSKYIPVELCGQYDLQSLKGTPIRVAANNAETRTVYEDASRVALLCSADLKKDQSFWLSQIDSQILRSTVFPVGNYHKSEVKKLAEQSGLAKIAAKRESMGLCFVGKRREFGDFLASYVDDKPGSICALNDNTPLGQHGGVHRFTLGQRVVLHGVRSTLLMREDLADGEKELAYQKPNAFFVAKLDAVRNLVRVVCGTNHPALFTRHVTCKEPVWFVPAVQFPLRCYFRWQNKFKFQFCTVHRVQNHESSDVHYLVELDRPLRAVSPGQYAVLYNFVESIDTFECIGSMLIVDNEPNEYQLGNRRPIEWNVDAVQIDDREIVLR